MESGSCDITERSEGTAPSAASSVAQPSQGAHPGAHPGPPELVLSHIRIPLPLTSGPDANQYLYYLRAYRGVCYDEEKLILKKIHSTITYLEILRRDVEIAHNKSLAVDADIGRLRNAIRAAGLPLVRGDGNGAV
ncbi:hypothetical protein B0H12DRAFT_1103672 [Mycena haematopus]|nr:hypothetical protein B0H12DRAFT_1103672 [Mycena haematopus]